MNFSITEMYRNSEPKIKEAVRNILEACSEDMEETNPKKGVNKVPNISNVVNFCEYKERRKRDGKI